MSQWSPQYESQETVSNNHDITQSNRTLSRPALFIDTLLQWMTTVAAAGLNCAKVILHLFPVVRPYANPKSEFAMNYGHFSRHK